MYKVQELPSVVEKAPSIEGLEFITGSMFESIEAGGDCYILKNILHNYDDETCVKILNKVAEAIGNNKAKARLFIIDYIIDEPKEVINKTKLSLIGPYAIIITHPLSYLDLNDCLRVYCFFRD